ncbi:DUF899 domain-containing protein [Caulobacter segnis]|uniref:DUF899 domain-containing protein n=1 Tax=Caulobacter segnis TaxID=88688 RepID=UPI00241036BD|nr:DUF899 domain-containing protein [Caulobacter segnis]MDG2521887.1 DUF899 domain-containing protein [Caulobacter segnis]
MSTHPVTTKADWLEARLALLEAEKDLTRRSDAVARLRQALPWTVVDKNYRFDTEAGEVGLKDLFGGRSQLLVYHFMFGPDYKAGCPSCSAIADSFDNIVEHLQNHDVAFVAVSRAPLDKLLAYRRRMGWSFEWASSADSDFNFDYAVSFTEAEQARGAFANYRQEPPLGEAATAMPTETILEGPGKGAALSGTDLATYARERPGMSSFAIQDGLVHHAYSSYSRGVDALWTAYAWLDRAPKGRNEQGYWWRRRGEYGGA